jgi:predicted RNA binding protein YcfA (HicA-like mRNA interferase family)
MMNQIHNWTFHQVVKFLQSYGFVHHRTKGSHFQYKKITKERSFLVTVAYHGNKEIPRGTMNSIIRQSGIEKDRWVR